MNILEIFYDCIYGSAPESQVPVRDIFLCSVWPNIHSILRKQIYFLNPRTYISTISIKHAYDRRPAFTKKHIGTIKDIIENPDYIFRDTDKKGDFIFVKRSALNKDKFITCPVQICLRESGYLCIKCITFFPTKSKSYLQKYPTVWDREGELLLHRDILLTQSAQQ